MIHSSTIQIVNKYGLLDAAPLPTLRQAAHELADLESIEYPAARMRIKRLVQLIHDNIEHGRDPFRPRPKGGAMPDAGRPRKIEQHNVG